MRTMENITSVRVRAARLALAPVAALAALLSLAPATAAPSRAPQAPSVMTPEDVVTLRRPSDPRISPDGERVVLVVRAADLEANEVRRDLWMWDETAGGARQLTRSGSDTGPRWLPDGSGFAFLSERSGSTQVWLMSTAGGEPRKLTDAGSGVEDFELSPDGSRLAFTAVSLDEPDEPKGDDEYVFDAPRELPALWSVDLEGDWNAAEVARLSPEDLAVHGFAWSPDGSRLVASARPSTILDRVGETELYLVDPGAADDGGRFRRLTDNAAPEGAVAFAADGAVLFTATDAERFVNAETNLYRLDPDGGAIEQLAADYEYGLDAPLVRGADVYLRSGVRATDRLLRLSAASGELETVLGDEGTVLDADVAADGTIAYLYSDADELPALWLRDGEGTRKVFDPNGGRAWSLGQTRAITWTSTDGSEVEGLLTLPVGWTEGDAVPLVVGIHGGPESAHTLAFDPDYIDYAQVMAGLGWAVLNPNYRGGTNYGDAWVQGMNADSGGGDYEDIMSGVDHLVAEGIADPERLAVMGWSWGGISTGWIVTQTDRFAAASAGAMVSNHFSVFGQADLTFDVELFYIGGSPWEDPARYLRHSPIGHVMNATTPTLLIHGEEDERCPLPQSVEFYKGLRAAGAEARLVVYPREPHVFREPRHQLDKMQREIVWFREHGLR